MRPVVIVAAAGALVVLHFTTIMDVFEVPIGSSVKTRRPVDRDPRVLYSGGDQSGPPPPVCWDNIDARGGLLTRTLFFT